MWERHANATGEAVRFRSGTDAASSRDGRCLCHELAVGQLARRSIFRTAACIRRHRQSDTCVDLGGLIVRVLGIRSAIPLFGRVRHHSSVPTSNRAAVASSGGPGRPRGRREAALPWAGASTTAYLRSFGRSVRVVVPLFFVLMVSDATAVTGTRSAEHKASYRTSDPFADFIDEASRRFGVPVHWIRAVIDVESAGDVRARSPKGAAGLMQIMPKTWAELRLRYDLGKDPYDPHDNILAGAALSARTARPIQFAGFPSSLQRRTCSLRRTSRWSSIAD